MFDQSIKRIGFCCKYLESDQTQKPRVLKEKQQQYTEKTTTVAWLNRQTRAVAEQRMLEIVQHNMQSAYNLVEYVSTLPANRRMVRLGSNQIPMATEPRWRYMWQDADNLRMLETGFARVGQLARERDVRLSFHPGQFCVLASETPEIVERSIEEFEYHADMLRWMGYGRSFQDFKINVHISGRRGPAGFRETLPRLSPEARGAITVENDEMCWGLDASLELADDCALVLDIHHHFVRTGEYINPTDSRYLRVIDSWRGVRPVIHYSYSRDEYVGHIKDELPNMETLLEQGFKKQKLRAHSDWYPNPVANEWALSFLDTADIMCESKMKNLSSMQLYEFWKSLKKPVSAVFESETDSSAYV